MGGIFSKMQTISYSFKVLKHILIDPWYWKLLMPKVRFSFFFFFFFFGGGGGQSVFMCWYFHGQNPFVNFAEVSLEHIYSRRNKCPVSRSFLFIVIQHLSSELSKGTKKKIGHMSVYSRTLPAHVSRHLLLRSLFLYLYSRSLVKKFEEKSIIQMSCNFTGCCSHNRWWRRWPSDRDSDWCQHLNCNHPSSQLSRRWWVCIHKSTKLWWHSYQVNHMGIDEM